MSAYREIVTKTIVGKGKKTFINEYKITTEEKPTYFLNIGIFFFKPNFSAVSFKT